MRTPVALTLFNNPDAVQRVFARIREARPPKLFLISDAGRNPEEQKLIDQSRAIAEAVDWQCEVFKRYPEKNLGAKLGVSSGISWVFEHVDCAIILEHDCLPDPTFFTYCEELLEKYSDDKRVMHISGTNFHQDNPRFECAESYYFSQIPLIWGFATWKRAWQYYDVTISDWPTMKYSGFMQTVFSDIAVRDRWEYLFDKYYRGDINSWDGQWTYACFTHNGLSITPAANLVSNIGFGEQALTTRDASSILANVPAIPMHFPLNHPQKIQVNTKADEYIQTHIFDVRRTTRDKIKWGLLAHIPGAAYLWRIFKGRS